MGREGGGEGEREGIGTEGGKDRSECLAVTVDWSNTASRSM